MRRQLVFLFCLLALGFTLSCERLDPEPFTSLEAIPLEYGELVGVTAHGAHPYEAVLWFEKPDNTIVFVQVNVSHGTINPSVGTVSRR